MENNINVEELKKQAIDEILTKIEKQIEKFNIEVGDMNFDKVSTIERSDEGRIILQYPLENPYEVGGKSNWTKIIVYPDGFVRIMGNQLDANKRAGKTDTANGAYAFDMKLEDWKESKTIKKAIDADYEEKIGVLEQDSVEYTAINTNNVYSKLEKRNKECFECEEEYKRYRLEGYELPKAPCVRVFENELESFLIVTPKQATELIKARQKDKTGDIVVFSKYCGDPDYFEFDIYLDEYKVYVVESKDILEQDEETKKADYKEYKTLVLDMVKNADEESKDYFYSGVIGDELLKDKEFVEEATKYDPSIKEMAEKVEENQEYGVEEIEDVVSDRTVSDLNKTVENIQEEKNEEKGENNKKKNKKDIVDDE